MLVEDSRRERLAFHTDPILIRRALPSDVESAGDREQPGWSLLAEADPGRKRRIAP